MSIGITNLSKRFGAFQALDRVDLEIARGELVALLGPSGCGKTTLLRLIAGLEVPDEGQVHFDGADVTALPARQRGVGFVFQHYALFRHMSVFENVAFGLRVKPRALRPEPDAIRAAVERALALVKLGDLGKRYPDQLSGGQRQRVALARALIIEPRVLLLDEPFGALDAQVRRELRRSLRRLHEEIGVTSVFVTHDQEEALDVADRIVVLNRGRIEQAGSVDRLYDQPANAFVCGFLGETNRLPATLAGGRVQLGDIAWPVPAGARVPEGPVDVCVRPHDFRIATGADPGAGLAVNVMDSRRWGGRVWLEVAATTDPALRVEVETDAQQFGEQHIAPGERVWITPARMFVYPRASAA